MAYRSSIKVRFGDEDHAGIVYYPRFFDFFHHVFEDFFDQHGHPYRKVLDEDHAGWPSVNVRCDYSRPLRFGDVLDVEMWVSRIGQSSATFVYRGKRRGDDELAVRAEVTVACIDMRTFESRPIPEVYRALFAGPGAPPPEG